MILPQKAVGLLPAWFGLGGNFYPFGALDSNDTRRGPLSEEPANFSDLTDRFVDFLMEERGP